ncbi:TPA: hypothetical protein I7721_16385 [Vibrio vulnificus]|nr:hypothetical protein [Vibrio vulnificus]
MYSFDFIITLVKGMEKVRILLCIVNVFLLVMGGVIFNNSNFFYSNYYSTDKVMVGLIMIVPAILNIAYIFKNNNHDNKGVGSNSLFSLWIKRKKLENEAKIKELEK